MKKRAGKFYVSYSNQDTIMFLINIKKINDNLYEYLGSFLSNKLKRCGKFDELKYYIPENKTDYIIIEFNDEMIDLRYNISKLDDLDVCLDGYEIMVKLDNNTLKIGCFYNQNFYFKNKYKLTIGDQEDYHFSYDSNSYIQEIEEIVTSYNR